MTSLPAQNTRALRSKVSRLPRLIRECINEMLRDGKEGGEVLDWLNAQPEVTEKITPQNLSVWRNSGYKDWLGYQKEVETLQRNAEFSLKIAEAGGANVASGAAAIMAGKLLPIIQTVGAIDIEEEGGLEKLQAVVGAVTSLQRTAATDRRVSLAENTIKQRERQLDQRERELNLNEEKFRLLVSEKILDAAKSPEVQAVLGDASLDRKAQLDFIAKIMFGNQMPDFNHD